MQTNFVLGHCDAGCLLFFILLHNNHSFVLQLLTMLITGCIWSDSSVSRVHLNLHQDPVSDFVPRAQHYSSRIHSESSALTPFLLPALAQGSLSLRIFEHCSSGSEFHGVKASITAIVLRILDTVFDWVQLHYSGLTVSVSDTTRQTYFALVLA